MSVHPTPSRLSIPTVSSVDADSLRIGVIGSGIAGLSVAWLLTKPERDRYLQRKTTSNGDDEDLPPTVRVGRVCLYERAASLGMDADALDTDIQHRDSNGEPTYTRVRLDMPLRVFTEAYYPHLTSLYDTVEVKYQPEDYSGSFSSISTSALTGSSDPSNDDQLYFGYRNLLLGPWSFPFLLNPFWRSVRTLTSWRILKDLIRFHFFAKRSLRQWESHPHQADGMTLEAFIKQKGFSEDFIQKMLLPTLAGILTCSHASVLNYPAPIVLSYWCRRSLGGVRRVCAGTQHVVRNLTQHVDVHLSTSVVRIECIHHPEDPHRPMVRVTDSRGDVREFDHVVLACQANQAAKMLKDADIAPSLLAALQGIKYEESRLVTHSDPALMPADRKVWNSVNFILPQHPSPSSCSPSSLSDEGMATIWLNRAQTSLRSLGMDATPIFQTWNPLTGIKPKPELILHDATFERPVVTHESIKCVQHIQELQGDKHIWFCGSYATIGMPLLETAVSSSVRVAQRLGQPCPWTPTNSGTNISCTSPRPSPSSSRSSRSTLLSRAIPITASVVALLAAAAGATFTLKPGTFDRFRY